MKKLKTIIACLILLCSCVIFASCQQGDEKVEFGETSPIVMEIGEIYSPKISVSQEKYLADLKLSTSDSRVVVISPDNKLVAIGAGTAQIEAKIGQSTANLVVEVVAKRTKLQTPSGFFYEGHSNRIAWSAVNNANSYDVEVDGTVVAKNITTNFYEIDSSVEKSIRVKANGIGKFSDSDFSKAFKFKNLQSPTNLSFDKATQTLTWDYEGEAQFKVWVNNISFDTANKQFSLQLKEAGAYDICVVAVAGTNHKDGNTLVFDSRRSQSLQITRLGDVDKNSIVWNPSESLLTWSEVEGAKKYEVVIGGKESQHTTTNSLKIDVNSFQRGEYEIRIKAISDSDESLVLNSINVAEKIVAITKQLQTPVIQKYDESANKLTLIGFDEAQNFIIFSNGQIIPDVVATISDSVAEITLPVGAFNEAGEYSLTAISKADEERFYTQSAPSEPYVITRLAAPTNLRIENGRHFVFSPNEDAKDYKLFVASVEKTLNGTTYDLSYEPEGERFIEVQCIGDGNTILSSANASLMVTKLSTPELGFDKDNLILKVKNVLSDHDYKIKISDSVYEGGLPSSGYALSGKLSEGNNVIQVQTLTKENEILSDIKKIDVYQLEEIQNLSHESEGDVSYIKFSTNSKFDNVVVSLGDQTLDYTFEGENDSTTVLKLALNTSQIFKTEGDYTLTVEAKSTDPNTINPAAASLKIKKLPTPENFGFTFPNKFTWDTFDDIANNFNLVITKGDNAVERFDQNIQGKGEYVAVGLPLESNLTAKLKVLGNNKDVLDSNFVSINFDHNKLTTPTSVSYENDCLTWDAVEDANEYEIYIGDNTFSSQTNSFETKSLEVGQYSVQIKAKHTNDPTISSDASSQYFFTITRKLSAPTNLTFDKSNLRLSWNAVTTDENNTPASATKYQVNIYKNDSLISSNYTSASQEFYEFYNSTFLDVGEYVLTVQACGDETDDYIKTSEESEAFKLTKLAAPTQIKVTTEEVVWCSYDINTTEKVEILINDTDTNSLADFDGEIKIKAKFVGKTINYLDSEYGEFERTRLLPINNLRIENDKVMWDENSYVDGYLFSVQYGEELAPYEETIEEGVTEKEFEFDRVGSYTLTMTALGNKTIYLNSRPTTIQSKKLPSPTNLSLSENPEESIVTLTFESTATDILGYEIFVDGSSIGTHTEKTKDISSSVFSAVGQHEVYVVAIGDNSKNAISSKQSESFLTHRLAAPESFGVGHEYYGVWNAVHSQTEYRIQVSHGEGENLKIIKTETTASTSISFAEQATSDEFKDLEGTINISVCSLGNNSTLLRSLTTTLAVPKTPKTDITSDADKVYFSRIDPSCFYEITILLDEDKSNPIKNKEILYEDEFAIPTNWPSGEYTFIVRQIKAGEFISGYTTFVKEKLQNVDSTTCEITRSAENEDVLILSWDAVENASGYVVKYSNSLSQENAVELYRGTDNSFALPDTIKEGQVFFWLQSLGSAEKGFSSNFIFYNVSKLSQEDLNVRNENGVLSWNLVGTAICSGYKIVVNGDNKNAIKLDATTSSYNLTGVSGKLDIKIKALGNFETSFGIDSDYDVTFDSNYANGISIDKLPAPTNVRVVEGAIKWDFDYHLDEEVKGEEEISYVINIDGKQYATTTEGIQQLSSELIPNKQYTATLQAKHSKCLTSDESNEIVVKLLENPNANDGSTYIKCDDDDDKTTSTFHWASATGASEYQVKIEGGALSEPTLQVTTDTKFTIPQLDAGNYTISVRRIGSTGAQEGVCYLSSGFSTPISFTVLSAPEVVVENGQIVWNSQDGANDYYIYVGEGHKKCGNVTSWTFLNEYINFAEEKEIVFKMQAVGDGVQFLASAKTSEITVVKPRPPQMLVVKGGALCWDKQGTGDYTYYDDTENKQIYLDFVQNGVTYESFEIDVNLIKDGWPLGDNYLQKITSNLPAGEYTLKIKQIGDSKKVITSEYAEQTLDIVVAPNPTNVKFERTTDVTTKEEFKWDKVELSNYNETNEITYVIYVFDSEKGDWEWLAETTNNYFSVENSEGVLKPQHTAIAVATKGNTTAEGRTNYVTGNMSKKDIIVLGSTSDLQTVEGNLTWGIIANTQEYLIKSDTSSITVDGTLNSSFLESFGKGEHTISVRALGNGVTKDGKYVVNGVWGNPSTFTKLVTPEASTNVADSNKLEWGSFIWEAIDNADGYNIFVNDKFHKHISKNTFESDYEETGSHNYQFQAKGNSVTPSATNIAYISSDFSAGLSRERLPQITDVKVENGILKWNKPVDTKYEHCYFVDFYQDGKLIERVYCQKEELDIAGKIKSGSYQVYVRETINNSSSDIIGFASVETTITKLATPSNVSLVDGVLTWDNVDGATGYVVRLVSVSDKSTTNIVEGFSQDEAAGTWRWVSTLELGEYKVSVRAVSTNENELNSSWATKNGELEGDESDWTVTQIPALSVENIGIEDTQIVWGYDGEGIVPDGVKYVYRKNNNENEIAGEVTSEQCDYEGIQYISIKTVPTTGDYFASVFSEWKEIQKPAAPTVTFDETKQIFTWDKIEGADVSYKVYYKIGDAKDETTLETTENKFEPTVPGEYTVKVQLVRKGAGTSDPSTEATGTFNLFTSGEGTEESPFEVNKDNFKNIMLRPNAHFKLTENITWTDQNSLGDANDPFLGHLDGNKQTITLSFTDNTTPGNWVGLFGCIGNGASVTNLKIEIGTDLLLNFENNTIYVGILAGQVGNGNEGTMPTISNCTVSNCTVGTEDAGVKLGHQGGEGKNIFFGGLVGWLQYGKITDSTNNLNITYSGTATGKIGGIVGIVGARSSINATVQSCVNNGNISGANTSGGIAAYNYGTITTSKNTASITGKTSDEESSIESIAGGIVGENFGKEQDDKVTGGIVQDCENRGAIGASKYAGGIVGQTDGGKIDGNYGMAKAEIKTSAGVSDTSAGAVVGHFVSYSASTTNYYLTGLSNNETHLSCTLTEVDADKKEVK